jgi:hypothetical protein
MNRETLRCTEVHGPDHGTAITSTTTSTPPDGARAGWQLISNMRPLYLRRRMAQSEPGRPLVAVADWDQFW